MIDNIFQMINETVPIHDLLLKDGAIDADMPRDRNMKISCPFHADVRKSGFIYADTNSYRCFACNESWDVSALYAQLNDLWKAGPDGDDVLDMGRAIAGLKDEYRIEYERPEWEERFQELKGTAKPSQGYPDFRQADREQMVRLYLWNVSQVLSAIPKVDRVECWEDVRDLLDEAEDLDIGLPSWKDNLNLWRERATLMVGGNE